MSDAAPQATVAVAKPQMRAPSARVQRKCACGGPASSFAGECSDCASKKRLGIQAKLQVGAPGDAFEQEADRVAASVMAGRNATPPPSSSGHDFAALPLHAPAASAAGPGPAELLNGGSPLPASVRAFFEPRFGRDFGAVRLHTGALAHAHTDRLQAHAFTYDSHIWLGRGHAAEPNFLMAHELAHVIQQHRPPTLKSANAVPLTGAARGLQRLPFWVPLGAAGRLTGTDLHEELLANAQTGNPALDIEAPAPNANGSGVGLGLQGSIDLYLGTHKKAPHVMPGLYFAGTKGSVNADVQTTRATKHRRANAAGIAAGRYRPFVSGRTIEGIDTAPDTIQLGELKPASSEMLVNGARQLGYYRSGLIEAQRLTNDWAALNKKPQRWTMSAPSLLPDQAVRFRGPQGGDMRYNPGAPRDDRVLVLADIKETSAGKIKVKVRFNPELYGLPPIRGGLYAQHYGNGLWMYFSRPRDLPTALLGVRSARIGAEMAVANAVQDQVVNPLLQGPVQAAPLRRREAPVVRRQPKAKTNAPPLEDKFNLEDWNRDQTRLRTQVDPDKAKGDKRSELGVLQLFAEAQAADKVAGSVSGAGGSTMPAIRQHLDVVAGTGATRKVHKRDLDQVLHWMRTWTSRPASILGRFRKRFGSVFVKLAGFLSKVGRSGPVQRVKAALQNLFKRMSGGRGGSALADLAIKGVTFALHQIADLLLPPTFRLVASAIHAGIRKKLTGLFELDLATEAKNLFSRFTDWLKHLEVFGTSIESIGEKIVSVLSSIQKIADTIRKVVGYIEDAASIVKWGIRAAQCSGVVSCITIVLEPVKNWAIRKFGDKALQACGIRYLIAKGVLGFFSSVPAALARGILGLLKRLVPSALGPVSEIFDEQVADEPLPPASDIVDDECWSIDLGFSLLDGFRTSKPKSKSGGADNDEGEPAPPKQPSARKPPPAAPPPIQPTADPDDPAVPPQPWTPDVMRIYMVPGAVKPGATVYQESKSVHTRLSASGSEYSLFCVDHLSGAIFFVVDQGNRPRPQPFTVPVVGLTLEVDGREVQRSADPKPGYLGSGFSLKTQFKPEFAVPVMNGDDFRITATLQDPDSGTSLTYRDRVKVRVVPCA